MTVLQTSTRFLSLLCLVSSVIGFTTTATFATLSAKPVQSPPLQSSPNSEPQTVYPPLSGDEVRSLLDSVPVYAVSDPAQDGLILIQETNNPVEICNFFLSPLVANNFFKRFQNQKDGSNALGLQNQWEIRQYPLGTVWAELMLDKQQPVDYRLYSDEFDRVSAKNVLSQQKQPIHNDKWNLAQTIPVFLDPSLRIEQQNQQRMPIYLSYQDFSNAMQRASSVEGYRPTITLLSLDELLDQMMKLESPVDFRNSVFVPPSLPNTSSSNGNSLPTASSDQWDD